ncbi:hypothetical protein JVT61DRAFT_15620 [Boletus reticuloceps]|uniref:Uncharacterized protein n=1 Tax=Boletus reticuloceps TaxID=495285 RepID=A0A8I2YC72_9AGAM|nr:hypothetical protein JVT61DRAFT_15620 [Boletus reticuloceps]
MPTCLLEAVYGNAALQQPSSSPWSMNVAQNTFLYQPENLGNGFSVLTNARQWLLLCFPQTVTPSLMSAPASPTQRQTASQVILADGSNGGAGSSGGATFDSTVVLLNGSVAEAGLLKLSRVTPAPRDG